MKKTLLRELLMKRYYKKHVVGFKLLDKVEDAKVTVVETKPKRKKKSDK